MAKKLGISVPAELKNDILPFLENFDDLKMQKSGEHGLQDAMVFFTLTIGAVQLVDFGLQLYDLIKTKKAEPENAHVIVVEVPNESGGTTIVEIDSGKTKTHVKVKLQNASK